jgi:hypothetical protein
MFDTILSPKWFFKFRGNERYRASKTIDLLYLNAL